MRGKEGDKHPLFAIFATEPYALTAPVHAAAMPVIVTGDDLDVWMDGSLDEALKRARPFSPAADGECGDGAPRG